MSKITNKIWFTTRRGGCIGIVTIKNEAGERKAYIESVAGIDEEQDALFIRNNGTPVSKEVLQAIVNYLEKGG